MARAADEAWLASGTLRLLDGSPPEELLRALGLRGSLPHSAVSAQLIALAALYPAPKVGYA
jgi:hypothetical protein